MTAITFFVPGIPSPGGSKRAFRTPNGKIVVREDAKRSAPWRSVVQLAARTAHAGAPLEGPLRLALVFVLPRPKGHTGKRGLRASAPSYPATRPDTTKLIRALEDACTAILWRDDAQIVEQTARKVYGVRVGVEVTVACLA